MVLNCASKHICSQLRGFGGVHDAMMYFSWFSGMLPSIHTCRVFVSGLKFVISSDKFAAGTIIF